ncbi:MAG: hypothetical protein ACYC3F_13440 [Gemmatimonadaceae bacterium]
MALRLLKGSLVGVMAVACGGGGDSGGTTTAPVKDPAVVGAAGGTVSSADGRVAVSIPPGAVSSSIKVTITPVSDDANEHVVRGSVYEFGPSGTQFAQPVELKLAYDTARLGTGADLSALQVARRSADGAWTPLPGLLVDSTNRTVRGLTSSFSTYGVTVDPCSPRNFPAPQQGIAIPYAGALETGDCRTNGIRSDVWRDGRGMGGTEGGWGEYELTSTVPHRALVGSGVRSANAPGDWSSYLPSDLTIDHSLPSGGTTLVRIAGRAPQVGIAGLDSTVRGAYAVRYQPMTSRQLTTGNGCTRGVYVEEGTSVRGELSANGDCAITIQYSPFPEVNGKVAYADYFWVKARNKSVRLIADPISSDTTKYGTALAVFRNGQVVTVRANRGTNTYDLDMRDSGGVGYYLVEVSNGLLWQGEWRNPTTEYEFRVQCISCAAPGGR